MNDIFAAIYARLVAQLDEPVYDHVPQDLGDDGYPFVKMNPLQLENNDTVGENGFEATIDIIGYSRYRGTKQINSLTDNIYAALHHWQMPNTALYGISIIYELTRQLVTAPDGLTRNSVQRYRIVFEPLP